MDEEFARTRPPTPRAGAAQPFSREAGSPDDAVSEAQRLGSQAKEAAASLGADLKEVAQRATEEVGAKASELASGIREKVEEGARDQKTRGADALSGVARAISSAAAELEGESPAVARYVRGAASTVEDVSRSMRERSVAEIVDVVSNFARSQPVAFFAGAVLAGFALSRFLKSSSERAAHHAREPEYPGARGAGFAERRF